MKKNEKKDDFLEKAADIFDLPGEIVAGMPRLTITGCRRAFVESHHGILEYSREEIHVNGGRVIIKFIGSGMELRAMSDTELLITGKLSGVEFEY